MGVDMGLRVGRVWTQGQDTKDKGGEDKQKALSTFLGPLWAQLVVQRGSQSPESSSASP